MSETEIESYDSVWDEIADTPEQAANQRTLAEPMQKTLPRYTIVVLLEVLL